MEPSSVVDLTRDEDDLVASQNNEVPENNCPERPGTPNLKCSICLEDITNKCYSDSCFHTFCFECLKRWSDVQPSCPLCKSIFKNIHHSFTSHGLHETYNVPSQEVVDRDRRIYIIRTRDTNGRFRVYSNVRREQLSSQIIRAAFNIPVPEDLRITQGETIILDNEHINTVTSQFQPGIIELSSNSSDMEIVNPPVEPPVVVNPPVVNPPVETLNITSFNDQPSTSTGIRNSLNEPNNRYNLRKRRLFPSTSSSSSYPANLSNKRSPTQLRRGNNINSSSSDEEYMTSSGEEFIPSARGSQCPHLDKPAAFKRKKKTTKKNKYKKQKKD